MIEAENSFWEPLGDPSARVFEVFLKVSQSQNTPVTTERTITPPSRLGALRWVGHRLRLEKRSKASKEWKRMVKFKSTFEAMKLPACPSFDPC